MQTATIQVRPDGYSLIPWMHPSGFCRPLSARSAALRETIRIMEPNEVTTQGGDAAYSILAQRRRERREMDTC
jgi:hypothetical protein